MLRVLCFGRFFDDIPGGMQTHVGHLFRAMKGHVDYVHLVPSRDCTSFAGQLHGFPLIRTASWNVDGSLALSPRLFTEARALHRKKPFDLIHLHLPDPMSHIASWSIPASVPRVITWHSDIIRQKLMLTLYKPFQNILLQQARAIMAHTPSHFKSSRYLNEANLIHKHRIGPFGFDIDQLTLTNPLTSVLRNRYAGKRIFALGRHVHYKGFDILIKAMDSLPNDTQLIIGGDGPLTAQWKALASIQKSFDRIHFAGNIAQQDLSAYFQSCDIFCLPAVNQAEAFGVVQVEAMACSKPVVSTRLNNGVDYVNQHGHTGITVPPGNITELASALLSLLANPDLRNRYGNNGLLAAKENFSLDALRTKTLAVYQEAVAKQTES
jgi:glycosyltransferase involved in cell wall biosynthesis